MKNVIWRGLILLLISLVPLTPALSQITLDSTKVKEIALIFAEHEKLSIENPLLKQQVASLEELNNLYVKTDSIQKIELNLYQDKVISDEKQIKKLKSTQKKTIIGSSIGGVLLFILGLII